jgi:transposase
MYHGKSRWKNKQNHYSNGCFKGAKKLKTPTCPECNSKNVAFIFWGYPGDMDWYIKAIEKKEIVGGGCLVSENDPKWECTDCYHRWGERDDDGNDSFDYDQGFNLDEVYG